MDPFSSGELGVATSDVPPVEMCDLASYLVLRTSFLIGEGCAYLKGAWKISFNI